MISMVFHLELGKMQEHPLSALEEQNKSKVYS
jgi:hypothetical protein